MISSSIKVLLPLFVFAAMLPACQSAQSRRVVEPDVPFENHHPTIVIGHRGASGYRPEHTLEAYRMAIEMGADFIEPDLVMTKDGVLVARHENEISETTNVAEVFPNRRTTKKIDGQEVAGYFTEDFTLEEIKLLRTKERLAFRDQTRNGIYEVPTLEEILAFVIQESLRLRRTIGVYPEIKHPEYFQSIGLSMEDTLLVLLEAYGFTGQASPVFIQSFEPESLRRLRPKTTIRLVQLMDMEWLSKLQKPAKALDEVRSYADGVGPNKNLLVALGPSLIEEMKSRKLLVHPWTHRLEAQFVNEKFKGKSSEELKWLFSSGVDGVFSDFPDEAIQIRNEILSSTLRQN